jgi:mRNA-degrading endonuclease RelE of RelBE toxin-antitoxin system
MTIKVDFTPLFVKELERLSRKYPRVTNEVSVLVESLEEGEQLVQDQANEVEFKAFIYGSS